MADSNQQPKTKKKYLVTVIEFDESALGNDLAFSEVPDAVGMSIDDLTPHGALDTKQVFLLTEQQHTRVTAVLQHNSLPYPELIAKSLAPIVKKQLPHRKVGNVVFLHDRRRRTQKPGDDS